MNLDKVHELADALTDPHVHAERIEVWDKNRHRKIRVHTTTQPGLLAQLAELMLPGGNPDALGGVAGSRPPGRWDATATHATITIDAVRWCWALRLEQRETVESNIRQLVGAYPAMDEADRSAFARSVATWHRSAEIVCGWKTPPRDPRAPCPAVLTVADGSQRVCGQRSLRVSVDDAQAFCGSCSTEWTGDALHELGAQVQAYRVSMDAAAADVRNRVRALKEAGRGAA